MTAINVHVRGATEAERVLAWRLEELQRAGYAPLIARRLARKMTVDLHLAVDLVRRGCTPDVAAKILL
jgi:hypothetical protein